jgi:hypothetical protein
LTGSPPARNLTHTPGDPPESDFSGVASKTSSFDCPVGCRLRPQTDVKLL